MLLLQHINLYWDKVCRGAPYSTERNQMVMAYELPKKFYDYYSVGFPTHYVSFMQTKDGIGESNNRIIICTKYDEIRYGALELYLEGSDYRVNYRYDFHRGAIPERHKYDVGISRYIALNETAMVLAPDEYGRLIYNGRFKDYDMGSWYYQLDIVNIINVTEDFSPRIFLEQEPVKEYRQIAHLY
ncbi:MAG: hypothetical protein ACRDBO_16170 [Lachnospiraceae bacterium]